MSKGNKDSLSLLIQLPLNVYLLQESFLNVIFQSLLGKHSWPFYVSGFLASVVAFAHPWDFAKSGNFAQQKL